MITENVILRVANFLYCETAAVVFEESKKEEKMATASRLRPFIVAVQGSGRERVTIPQLTIESVLQSEKTGNKYESEGDLALKCDHRE